MKNKHFYLNTVLILIFFIIIIIFLFSSQTGDDSHNVSEFAKRIAIIIADNLFLGNILRLFKDYNIRKIAHFTIFFILGSLVYIFIFKRYWN